MVITDVLNDGSLDIISSGKSISYYQNLGEAGFAVPVQLQSSDNFQDVYEINWNNDGLADLLILETEVLSIMKANPNEESGFEPRVVLDQLAGTTKAFVGDINEDQFDDFILYQANDGLSVYLNQSNESEDGFSMQMLSDQDLLFDQVWIEDFNSDGKTDVMVYSKTSADPSKLTFWSANEIWFDTPVIVDSLLLEPLIADLDYDGLSDIVLFQNNVFDVEISWRKNMGGTFQAAETIQSIDAEYPSQKELLDVDGDQDLDLVIASEQDTRYKVRLYERIGPFQFTESPEVISVSEEYLGLNDGASSFCFHDFTGDNKLDLLTSVRHESALGNQSTLNIYPKLSNGNFDSEAHRVNFLDLSKLDCYALSTNGTPNEGTDMLIIEDGRLSIISVLHPIQQPVQKLQQFIDSDVSEIQWVDLDGDNDQDVFIQMGTSWKWIENQNGTYLNLSDFEGLSNQFNWLNEQFGQFMNGTEPSFWLKDIDQDEITDFLVLIPSSASTRTAFLALGLEPGVFEAFIPLGNFPLTDGNAHVGSFKSIDKIDFVFQNSVGIEMWSQNDLGDYEHSQHVINANASNWSLGIEDLNGDELDDLVYFHPNSQFLIRYGSNPEQDGSFTFSTMYHSDIPIKDFWMKDVNGDGWLDFVGLFRPYGNQPYELGYFLNFKEQIESSYNVFWNTHNVGPEYFSFGDFNGDRNQDIIFPLEQCLKMTTGSELVPVANFEYVGCDANYFINTTDGFLSSFDFEWYLNDELISNDVHFSYGDVGDGIHNVKLVACSSVECDSTVQVVVVNKSAEVQIPTSANVFEPVHFEYDDPGFNNISWIFGDGSVSTEESPTHVYNVPGTYQVELFITQSDVLDCTQHIIRTIDVQTQLGIHQNSSSIFSVVPNPSNGIFRLDRFEPELDQLKVYSSTGKLLIDQDLDLNSNWLDLSAFPKGVYLLELSNHQNRFTKKIVYQ